MQHNGADPQATPGSLYLFSTRHTHAHASQPSPKHTLLRALLAPKSILAPLPPFPFPLLRAPLSTRGAPTSVLTFSLSRPADPNGSHLHSVSRDRGNAAVQ